MRKIMREKIVDAEERPLSETDLSMLTAKRNKQLTFLLSGYAPLALILLYVFINGLSVITRRRMLRPSYEPSEEMTNRFHLVAPYVCGVFFIMLTIYFLVYYLQTVAPMMKDVKSKKKLLLHFIPEKTEMGVFNKYYLSTPVIKKQQIQIQREDFYRIPAGSLVIVEVTPYSQMILRFTYDGKECEVPL